MKLSISKIPYVIGPGGKAGNNWNFVYGCEAKSAGCANCWARELHNTRYQAIKDKKINHVECWSKPFNEVTVYEDRLLFLKKARGPKTVFVCSSSDLFHSQVPTHIIKRAFGIMRGHPQHTYLILTKRPERMMEYINEYEQTNFGMAGNIYLGTSIESNQVEDRLRVLSQIKWNHFWISFEPLIGPVYGIENHIVAMKEEFGDVVSGKNRIKSFIVGGESGINARPMAPEWAYYTKEVADRWGIDFYFKQWGRWLPAGECDANGVEWSGAYMPDGCIKYAHPELSEPVKFRPMATNGFKFSSGRFLDGKEYLNLPWAKE